MVAAKICGMRDRANIAAVAALGPDYLGFICWSGSQRFIGDELDADVLNTCRVTAGRVGVFVNQAVDEILKYVARLDCSVIQLHGDESREFCAELRSAAPGLEIWKMISLADHYPVEEIARYEGVVDRILFDTKTPARGGSGITFDWTLLARYQGATPIVLSGGLGLENVVSASSLGQPKLSILDFNSKLEVAPGVKDPALVSRVLAVIRATSGV